MKFVAETRMLDENPALRAMVRRLDAVGPPKGTKSSDDQPSYISADDVLLKRK